MPKISTEPILVGCELFVRKGNAILLGLRKNCYGAGTWALPGGHLEFGERMVDCICREAKEELGAALTPKDVRIASITDDVQRDNVHFVHVTFECKEPAWEPQLMEPDQCEEWRYFPLNDLPENFFQPHQPILDNYRNKRLYRYEP